MKGGLRAILTLAAVFVAPIQASDRALTEGARRVVKIFGAGGLGRVEGYGTGIIISADGDILTVFGPILLSEAPRVVLSDGRRFRAKVARADGQAGLALLDIDAEDLPFWDLAGKGAASDPGSGQLDNGPWSVRLEPAAPGTSAFALSNAFGIAAGAEAVSIQRATLAAHAWIESDRPPQRRGESGAASYILDGITGNPGSAGGALVDVHGHLLGLVGREIRDQRWNLWVNQALPAARLRAFLEQSTPSVAADEAVPNPDSPIDSRGIGLLPDVLSATPPFVDAVEPDSPAARAGFRPDDLIAFVGPTAIRSVADFRRALARTNAAEPVRLSVLRDGALLELELGPREK